MKKGFPESALLGYTLRAMSDKKTVSLADLKPANPNNIRPVYSNAAGVRMTTWDIHMLFSEVILTTDSMELEVRANVVMSPAHAKAFAAVLNRNIAEWEKDNGEIKWGGAAEAKSAEHKSAQKQ